MIIENLNIKELTYVRTLLFPEFPCTVLYKDPNGNYVIKEWATMLTNKCDCHYYYYVTEEELNDFLGKKITHYDLIKSKEYVLLEAIKIKIVKTDNIPESYLPTPDFIIDEFME